MWYCPPERVKNQYAESTCGPNAVAAIAELYFEKLNGYYTKLSPGFVSAFQLIPEWLPEGMAPHEVGEVLIQHGICEHSLLPEDYEYPRIMNYVTDRDALLRNSEKYKFKAFTFIKTVEEIREAIRICPVLIGTAIFSPFYGFSQYSHTMMNEGSFAGFHFLVIIKDLPEKQCFEVLNSYGPNWGKDGTCLMPYEYFPQFPLTKIVAFTPYENVLHHAIKEQLLFRNRPYTALKPEGLAIYATDQPGVSAQARYVFYNTGERNASVHYVGDSDEVIWLIPENEQSWHAGSTVNSKYLSLEMCEPRSDDPDRNKKFLTLWDKIVSFVANCCRRYHWSEKNIYSHLMAVSFFQRYGRTWDSFIQTVRTKIQEGEKTMQTAVVFWTLRDFTAAELIAAKLGNCGMFCRNGQPHLHPDAQSANRLIVIGGPEVTNHPNVKNLCGATGSDTLILTANYAKIL